MKFIVSQKDKEIFQFLLKDKEDRPILWSPRYTTKNQCLEGINQLRRQIESGFNYDKWRTESGRYVFHLKSDEGRLLAMSAPFVSRAECSSYTEKILSFVGMTTSIDFI